jgi:hypothetical protein
MLAMAKLVEWDTAAEATCFDRAMTAEQTMDVLEKRVGPKGRRLFEDFLRKVNHLQAEQELEAQNEERIADRG